MTATCFPHFGVAEYGNSFLENVEESDISSLNDFKEVFGLLNRGEFHIHTCTYFNYYEIIINSWS